MPFVERLYEIRIRKGLSQDDLARRTGLRASYIEQLETGQKIPSCQTLDAIAEALHVPLYQLFYNGQNAPQTPWLTPRRTLEELQMRQLGPKPESGFMGKVKVLRDELSALLH
jgi:transcriptional regulator with XRE-family HTH domain